jgi:hypothetical protein
LGRSDNVATFHLSPGYSKYTAFCTEAGFNDSDDLDNPIIAKPAQTVSDDETSDDNESSIKSGNDKNGITNEGLDEQYCQPIGKYFNLNGPKQSSKNGPTVVQDEEDRQPNNLAAENLRYHHRFGHISFQRLVEMAKQGVIPRRIGKMSNPRLLRLSVCQSKQTAMAEPNIQQHGQIDKAEQPWQLRISRSTGIADTRVDSSDDGLLDYKAIPLCHSLHRSGVAVKLHISTEDGNSGGDARRQTSFREVL